MESRKQFIKDNTYTWGRRQREEKELALAKTIVMAMFILLTALAVKFW